MKKTISILLISVLCLSLTGCSVGGGLSSAALLVLGIALAGLAVVRSQALAKMRRTRRLSKKQRAWIRNQTMMTNILYIIAAVLLIIGIIVGLSSCGGEPGTETETSTGATEPSTEVPTEDPGFVARGAAASDPANWQVGWEIFRDTMPVSSYTRTESISFGQPDDYFSLPGISTFRGNNYRDSATYGTAAVENEELTTAWTSDTTSLGSWTGSGWTGQPLMAKWPAETRAVMNLYADKKDKADLVEVIYATLDGHIYFLDLEDGTYTRDPINVGMAFKGAGALDPRGYPLMYVGSGDAVGDKQPRMFIISLIDGSILYEYGYADVQSLRLDNEYWCAFDSSPLIHAGTDTLIWPGESGILYTIKLNTVYDQAAGTISVAPGDIVKTRYTTGRSSEERYWYGYEPSCVMVEEYLYVAENGGLFFCVDLNTMELVWVQDTKDDNNSTPVFQQVSRKEGYIYTAPSLHWTQDENAQGSISIYKLDAVTGEIVWEHPIDCHTVEGVSGGIQSSPLLGKAGTELEGLIIYSVARTPGVHSGVLLALDTDTGETVWEMSMTNYAWSSPVAVYEADGNAYVVVCDSAGYAMLVDGTTGDLLYTISLGGLIEASPAVYENTLVVGTRTKKIVAVEIS
ncbi:MAG: PQQ-binding-like beta-propeller repeat protein [Oscillospiraceae bacterium]|nr:PQQ-binding-like beta-propeller repeat protein [Oscillospiraceae bacterium]